MADSNRGSISRRLRFEILRRDNHQCRYCGAAAPDAKLTVDHVVPTALGGNDEPNNLVAACHECNAGKAATSIDAPLVADIKADAVRWARAVEIAAQARLIDRERRDEYVARFEDAWTTWHYNFTERIPPNAPSAEDLERWGRAVGDEVAKNLTPMHFEDGALWVRARIMRWEKIANDQKADLLAKLNADLGGDEVVDLVVVSPHFYWNRKRHEQMPIPRPDDWRPTIWQFHALGLPIEEIEDAIQIACGARMVTADNTFRYFCGVCWKKVEQIREAASDVALALDWEAKDGLETVTEPLGDADGP